MHDSYVQEAELHAPKLPIGNMQHFDFKKDDKGPFCMNSDKRNASKHDVRTGKFVTLKKTKEMLVEELLLMKIVTKSSKENIAHVAKNNNIQIEHTKEKMKKG